MLLFACTASLARAEPLAVSLLLSDSTPPYRQFSDAFSKALAASNAKVNIAEFQADENFMPGGDAKTGLVVAVGMKAAGMALAKFDGPVLGVMIPKASYEILLENRALRHARQQTSAIFLDQPWDRQLNFIQAALPQHSAVGVLYSPYMSIALPRLPRGMSLNAKSVRSAENLFDSLENILSNSDVLLAVPDSDIYSGNNVRNILLTSYRHKVPLIGISQAYVNAGAIGAIFSTHEQLAEQASDMVASFTRNRRLPEPQHPASFTIALNQQVARSLGITLDSPEAIRERMNKTGEGEK